jgi:hypothetical protein
MISTEERSSRSHKGTVLRYVGQVTAVGGGGCSCDKVDRVSGMTNLFGSAVYSTGTESVGNIVTWLLCSSENARTGCFGRRRVRRGVWDVKVRSSEDRTNKVLVEAA